MTYHLEKETEDEFVASTRSSLAVIDRMVRETSGAIWNRNGTNIYITDVLRRRVQTAYYEALTYLGLGEENERLDRINREALFNVPEEMLVPEYKDDEGFWDTLMDRPIDDIDEPKGENQ
jgi:hypothetical protein